jgi:hypothetical protein
LNKVATSIIVQDGMYDKLLKKLSE